MKAQWVVTFLVQGGGRRGGGLAPSDQYKFGIELGS